MKLIDPITGGIVATNNDEATARLTMRGYRPLQEIKPKPKRATTRKKATKKEQ